MSKPKSIGETLHGMFYDVFRTVGANPNPYQLENLRAKCENMGRQFEAVCRFEAKLAAIEAAKSLQQAVQKGFERTDEELQKFEVRLAEAENTVKEAAAEAKKRPYVQFGKGEEPEEE